MTQIQIQQQGSKILTIVLLIAVLVMGFFLIWGKGPLVQSEYEAENIKLKNEIEIVKNEINIIRLQSDAYKKQVEKLQKADTALIDQSNNVKIVYRETYKFIPTATTIQLDSTIRANW